MYLSNTQYILKHKHLKFFSQLISISVESKLFIYDLTPPEAGIDENSLPDPTQTFLPPEPEQLFFKILGSTVFKNGFLKQSKFWPIWLNLCLGTADVLRTHYHIWKLIPDKKLYNLTLQYIVRQAILEHILKSTVEKNYLPLNLKSTSKFSSPPLNLRSTSKTPKSCMLWRCAGLQAKETNDK